MNWSLEHVHYPSRYFKFIFNHLKNNESRALICIPNYGDIYIKLINQMLNCLFICIIFSTEIS